MGARALSPEEVSRLRGERRILADKIARLRVHGAEWRRLHHRQAGITRQLLEVELGGRVTGPADPASDKDEEERLAWWQK